MALLEDVLAYKFLNNANIAEQHKQLVHATLSELKNDQNKDYDLRLWSKIKVFSDSINASWVDSDELNIKVEINMGQDTFFGNSNKFYHQRKVIIQDLKNDRK